MLKISSTFDSGAIEAVRRDDPADIRLRLPKDNAARWAIAAKMRSWVDGFIGDF